MHARHMGGDAAVTSAAIAAPIMADPIPGKSPVWRPSQPCRHLITTLPNTQRDPVLATKSAAILRSYLLGNPPESYCSGKSGRKSTDAAIHAHRRLSTFGGQLAQPGFIAASGGLGSRLPSLCIGCHSRRVKCRSPAGGGRFPSHHAAS